MAIRADVDEWRACRGGYHGLGSVSPTWEVNAVIEWNFGKKHMSDYPTRPAWS